MSLTRINLTPSAFPAHINLYVSDGVDYIFDLSVYMDNAVLALATGWTAEFSVKKGVEYQDVEFSCDETDHITLLSPVFENRPDLEDGSTHTNLVDSEKNIRIKVPSATTEGFSFSKGVYVLDITNGTDSHRVCYGDVIMKKFTSLNSYSV